MKRIVLFIPLLITIPLVLYAEEKRTVSGTVVSVGEHGEMNTDTNLTVTIQETSQSDVTNSIEIFRLFLPHIFKPGEKITLFIDKPDLRIQYPLDGEARIPADLK